MFVGEVSGSCTACVCMCMFVGEVSGICTAGVCMFVGEVSGSCTACVCMCIYTGTVRPCTAARLCLACTRQPSAASSSAAPTAAHARTSRRGVRSAHTRRSRTRGAKLICARRANVAALPRHWRAQRWIYATPGHARDYARPCTAVRGFITTCAMHSSSTRGRWHSAQRQSQTSTSVYDHLRDALQQHARTVAYGSAAVPDEYERV